MLERFIDFAIDEVDSAHKEDRIRFQLIPMIRETRRQFTGDFSGLSSTLIDKAITGVFHPEDFRKFFIEHIKTSEEYNEIVDFVETEFPEFKANLESLDFYLFSRAIRNHFWNIKPDIQSLVVEEFLNEFFEKPIPWKISIWLTGLSTDVDHDFQKIIIKKPTEEDIAIYRNMDEPPFWYKNPDRIVPGAILETTYEPDGQSEALFLFVRRLMMSLTLFKPGVDDLVRFYRPISLRSYSPHKEENPNARERGGYKLKETDRDELKYHLLELPELLPKNMLRSPHHQSSRLVVAYQCYTNAIYKLEVRSEIYTELVRGIESLYLPLDEKRAKARRLAKRVSEILSAEGFDAGEVKKNVEKAYVVVRNPSSHGSPINIKEQNRISKYIPLMIEYLRKSMLLLLKQGNESFIT